MLWVLIFGFLWVSSGAVVLPGIPVDFNASDAVLSALADDVANNFETEYVKFLKTGIESAALKQISESLAKLHSKKDIFTKNFAELKPADQFFTCSACRATARVVMRMAREEDGELNGPNTEEITKGITLELCERLDLQSEEVCTGLFESNYETVMFIARNSDMDSRTFCSLFLDYGFCSVKNPEYNWTLPIDGSGPAVTAPKTEIPAKSADDMHVLHLTDIHYDPLYVPGSLAECDEPICCQRHKDTAEGTSKAAGYWGDTRDCDAPWQLIESALGHIKKTHTKLEYIIQTGDVVDHMVWATSVKKNTEVLSKVNDKLAEMFPDVPVYPCIGNHEPHPLNNFSPVDAPENINTKWLYQHLYKDWSKWLPKETEETILKGGYYTVSHKPGFRIISLNNNDCYLSNWWVFYNGSSTQSQLQWLHDTLLAAEKTKEYVHILAHIPSGDGSCWNVWSREFNRIIERFRNTISGIFNGHSHKDELNVHISSNGHAIGLSWNGGSLTPYSFHNPNYKIFEIEPKSMQVVDHETWIVNLTEANLHGSTQEPVWFKEYVFSEEFTDNLSPAGINGLLDKMADTPELVRKFWRYKWTSGAEVERGCNRQCLLATICRLATTVNDQKKRCNELMNKLSIALDNESNLTTPVSTTPLPTTTAIFSTPSTSPETTSLIPPTDDPNGGDGASSIISLSATVLLTVYALMKFIL